MTRFGFGVLFIGSTVGFHDCVQPTSKHRFRGFLPSPPPGCAGGLCVGMHDGPHEGGNRSYPVGSPETGFTSVHTTFTVPELPKLQDGICCACVTLYVVCN